MPIRGPKAYYTGKSKRRTSRLRKRTPTASARHGSRGNKRRR